MRCCSISRATTLKCGATNRRVQVAKMPFQSPGDLDFGQNSGRFSVSKDPNVKSAKLLVFLLGLVFWKSASAVSSVLLIISFPVLFLVVTQIGLTLS